MARVLIVDGTSEDRAWLCEQFRSAGHDPVAVGSAAEALRNLELLSFDLVVTESTLPDASGMELVSRIRNQAPGNQPPPRFLMVAARMEAAGLARALDEGVNDFVVKPPRAEELLARAAAALRKPPAAVLANGVTLRVGPVTLDAEAHKVTVSDREIALAPVEFRLMAYFMAHPGRVLSRQQLLERVWNRRSGIGERTVDVHVRRLRAALEPHRCEDLLQTVRGFGYRFG